MLVRTFALLIMPCCAVPAFAYTVSGVNTDPAIDNPRLDITRYAMPPDVTPRTTPLATQLATRRGTSDSANPLWAIPLSGLMATRDRPLFSPSRRSSAPVLISTPVIATQPPPPPPALERPNLDLVGTVARETEAIAVFTDQGTHNAIRLRTGEGYNGWILQSVAPRVATLQKGNHSETLQLPKSTGPFATLRAPSP
jgi:general secretion pathway protein N